MTRDVAVSFTGNTKASTKVTGTVWFQIDGPISKRIIDEIAAGFCAKAEEQFAILQPQDLMIVNVFIAESE